MAEKEISFEMHSLRTLVITEKLPYPTMGGKDIRNWQNINVLMRMGQVGVFGLRSNELGHSKPPLPGLAFWKLSNGQPTKDDLAGRAWLLDPAGHPSDMYYLNSTAAELGRIMADFRPQLVVVEALWLHRYIDVLRQCRCRIVLDNHNVEAAVFREIADSTLGSDLPARINRHTLPERTKRIEQRATDVVDQVWVCSKDDARLMKELYTPSTPIHVVPNSVNIDYYEDVRAAKNSRNEASSSAGKILIFPASFRWEPNEKAAAFVTEQIFPGIVKIYPDCRVFLVGNDPTPHMMAVAERDSRIVVTGRVPDVRPYLAAASVMLVPLFQGSGTRLKILEAFASSIPVISTAKGAEGLDLEDGTHLLIAENTEEFVDAVERLWSDVHLSRQLTTNGLDLVKRSYSWATAGRRIGNAIHELALCDNN